MHLPAPTPYKTYASNLKWISETKTKLPNGMTFNITSTMRKEAFQADPLLKGTISTPFLKNMGFSKGTLHYMKQNAKSDKPFSLNTHVRERLENWV